MKLMEERGERWIMDLTKSTYTYHDKKREAIPSTFSSYFGKLKLFRSSHSQYGSMV